MHLGAIEAGGTKMVCAIGDENGNIPNQIDCAKMLLEKMGL